jgi:hypothetical protein
MPRHPRDDLEPEILLPDVAVQQRRAADVIGDRFRAIVYDPNNSIGREPRIIIFRERLEHRLRECRANKAGIDEGFLSMMMHRCELAQTRERRRGNGEPILRDGLLVCRLVRVGSRVRLTQNELANVYGRSRQFVSNQIRKLKDWCFIVNHGRGWYEFDASLCWCGGLGICAAYREIQRIRDGITFTDGKTTLPTEDMDDDCSIDDEQDHTPQGSKEER